MSVVEKLKTESLRLRKERNPIAPSITFALSEIEKVGKNAGNRVTTEDEAIKVLQKIVATLDENLKVASDTAVIEQEKAVLMSVLPQMASDEAVRTYLRETFAASANKGEFTFKGEVMKGLRAKFGSLVDMKRAGAIATEELGI